MNKRAVNRTWRALCGLLAFVLLCGGLLGCFTAFAEDAPAPADAAQLPEDGQPAPAEAPYTIVYWRQKTSDAPAAPDAEKQYEYAGEVAAQGPVGQPAAFDPERDAPGWDTTWFTLNTHRTVAPPVEADGRTELDVYYDRLPVTLRFACGSEAHGGYAAEMTGLYGSTLAQNGAAWPAGHTWKMSDGTVLTFLDALLPTTPGQTLIELECTGPTAATTTLHFLQQQLDGSWLEVNTAASGGGSFTFTEKYIGFSVSGWAAQREGAYQPVSAHQSIRLSGVEDLYIRFARNAYTLYLVSGEQRQELSVPYGAELSACLPEPFGLPERAGGEPEFAGWYDSAGYQSPLAPGRTMPAADLVLYARWEVPATVTLVGGRGLAPESIKAYCNDRLKTLLPGPEAMGEGFLGWYADPGFTRPIGPNDRVGQDMAVYAGWSGSAEGTSAAPAAPKGPQGSEAPASVSVQAPAAGDLPAALPDAAAAVALRPQPPAQSSPSPGRSDPDAAPAEAPARVQVTIQNPGESLNVALGEEKTPLAGPGSHKVCVMHISLLAAALLLAGLYLLCVRRDRRRLLAAQMELALYKARHPRS